MPTVHSQLYKLLIPSGPSHGDRGTALHQLWNTGLPVWIDHKFGSEYSGQMIWGRSKRHFQQFIEVQLCWGTPQACLSSVRSSAVTTGRHKISRTFGKELCALEKKKKKKRLKKPKHSTNTFLSSIYSQYWFSPPDQLFACGDDFQCQPTAQRMGLYYLVQSVNQRSSGRSLVCKY